MTYPDAKDYWKKSKSGCNSFEYISFIEDVIDAAVDEKVNKEVEARAAKAKRDTSSRTFIIQVTTKDQSYMSYIENDIEDALKNCKIKLETIGISELGVRTIEHPWSVREKKAAEDYMENLYINARKDKK